MSHRTRPPRFLESAAPKKDRPAFPAPAHPHAARPVHVARVAEPAEAPAPVAPASLVPPGEPPMPSEPAPLAAVELVRGAAAAAAERAPEPGLASGLDAASAERIAAAITALRLEAERLAEQARSDALEIGFLVARRILEVELTASPRPLFALIRSAVRRAGEARSISVRLSPRDAARVRGAGSDRALGELAASKVEIVEDPELGVGDCVVETDLGTVDGRLTNRLDELHRAATHSMAEGAS